MGRRTVIAGVVILSSLASLGGYLLFSDSAGMTNIINEQKIAKTEKNEISGVESEGGVSDIEENQRLIIGDEDAPVTIVEYSDFQCPFCARFFRDTEPQIREAYINEGLVKIDYRPEVHIGEGSIIAAQGAYCAADQNQFEAYHKSVFTKRNNGELSLVSKSAISAIAEEIDLNQVVFSDCLRNDTYREVVLASHNEAHQDVGISGTPTFIIGNRRIVGAQPFSVFKPIIDAELSRTN